MQPSVMTINVEQLPDGRMNRKNAALYLGVSVSVMALWHTNESGPKSVLVGGQRFYFKDDLDQFVRNE